MRSVRLIKPKPEQRAVTVRDFAERKLKREKLVLDWQKKQQARAAVQVCIRDSLDQLPAAYAAELRDQKCALVYQHVYDSYLGEGRSIYPAA